MSLIASFYLVPLAHCDGLIDAANAQTRALTKKRWGIFQPKLPLNPDPFWEYLQNNAREAEDFPYRGALLLDLEAIAPELLASSDPLGERLSEITQATFVSYRGPQAERMIAMLEQVDFSDQAIRAYLQAAGRDDEVPEFVDAIRDAGQRMKAWLGAVSDQTVGLLNIG